MRDKHLQLISQLSSYRGRYILFRIAAVGIVALTFMKIAVSMIADSGAVIPAAHYIAVMVVFNVITELNVLIDNVFERFYPVPRKIGTRILLHFGLSLLVGFFALVYFEGRLHNLEVLQQPITWLMFAFGLIFVFISIVISISLRITTKWIAARQEVERLRQLQMINDYNALQDQLNPHFLFNNLSILKSMIPYDPGAAVNFTQHFTDTYRYVLQNRDRSTVPLPEELAFIHSYLELHKERLGEALKVTLRVDPALHDHGVPPLSLQLLIENAIKHNVVSKENPLHIHIFSSDGFLCVENNLQPRESSYSTSKGLNNLRARYEFLTEKQVRVRKTDKTFMVALPLL